MISERLDLDLSPHTLRHNIWRACLSASHQEIHDGMSFYPGAHYICMLYSRIFRVSVDQVAGIYAALSPLNTWGTNVSNIADVLRWAKNPIRAQLAAGGLLFHYLKVNTPKVNRAKAIRIARGEKPLDVLHGSKVRAFYRGIANPDDHKPIPVDRHLLCLALGVKILDNVTLSKTAGSREVYVAVEKAYTQLGRREGLGNRLASIAWFVQRRIINEQIPLVYS